MESSTGNVSVVAFVEVEKMKALLILLLLLSGCVTMPVTAIVKPPPLPSSISYARETTGQRLGIAALVVPPAQMVTNGMVWTQLMPAAKDGAKTIPLDSPRWLVLDRFNTNTHQWTNCYDGPLTNGQYYFNSSAPMGVAPDYRATVEFKNAK